MNLFDWLLGKRSEAQRLRTNRMLQAVVDALHNDIDQWRLIECGNYVNKPNVYRIARYLGGLPSDKAVEIAVDKRDIAIDDQIVVDAGMRVPAGVHILSVRGQGDYRFNIN